MTCVLTWRDRHEHPLNTHIHVSGLSYFCTDDKLRQAFIPFGMVMLAQVLRDEWGHSLGLGIIHMARSEDVERVFNEHKRFEVAGSRVDLWEPAEPSTPKGDGRWSMICEVHKPHRLAKNRRQEKSRKAFQRWAVPGYQLVQTPASW